MPIQQSEHYLYFYQQLGANINLNLFCVPSPTPISRKAISLNKSELKDKSELQKGISMSYYTEGAIVCLCKAQIFFSLHQQAEVYFYL